LFLRDVSRMNLQLIPTASFEVPVVVLIVVAELLFLGPLLVFSPALFRAKRDGLLAYGALIDRYNRSFHGKWMDDEAPEHEPLLGSADIQSLADMGNSFRFVSDMGVSARETT